MTKHIILSSLFILFSFSGFSQKSLDSLKSVWNDTSLADTTRLDALSEIIEHAHIYSYLDSVAHYVAIQINESQEAGSDKHLAHAILYQGHIFLSENQATQGVALLDSASNIYERIGDSCGEAISSSLQGLVMLFSGQPEVGFALCEKAYNKMSEEAGLKEKLTCALNLQQAYALKGDLAEQIKFAKLSVSLAEELNIWTLLAEAYHKMADVYLSLEIQDEGDYYHEQALEVSRKSGYKSEEMNILGHLASIESERENHQKALEHIDEVVEWQEKNGGMQTRMGTQAKKIYILTKAKTYDQVPELIDTFRVTFGENVLGAKFYTAMVDYCEGKMLVDLGSPKEGAELCLAAQEGIADFHRYKGELEICECLYEAYKAQGKHESALEYHEKHQLIQENIKKEQVVKDLQRFEFHKLVVADSLAQVEKDRLVEVAHQEEVQKKNKTKNIFLGGGLLLLILAGGLYSRNRYIKKSKDVIEKEKDRSNNLLLNILPADIAEELKIHGKAEARDFDMVSILFTDFKGFTEASAKMSAADLVNEINHCFEAFDGIMEKFSIEKIKTIGDAYMAAGGLPVPTDDSIKNTVLAALEMQVFISERKAEMDAAGKPAFEMRVGIHTGPVVAGIVGVKKFQYDIWGDTVNTAARIESNGEAGKVNISQATYQLLKDDTDFAFESRGKIEAKGKGEIEMWFVADNA